MKKILIVFGTRPEAIKMAPIVKALKQDDRFDTRVCITAQHRQMLDQVLSFFKITPDIDLNTMKPGQDLFDVTSHVLLKMKEVLRNEKPDLVLVQGDTTTAFTTALAAFYEQIPIGHIEAGLRTHNLKAPFPEEANRQLVSRLADFHFAPTALNQKHLIDEGIDPKKIFITGNTVVDAILWTKKIVENKSPDFYSQFFGKAQKIFSQTNPVILVTGHRRESFGSGFERICESLKRIAEKNPNVFLVYPVHPNPNVKEPVLRILGGFENVFLIDPLEYEPFVFLMNRATLILTDSGGIQEEAPSLGKPVLVMRDLTERQEAIDSGIIKLVGTNVEIIVSEVERLLNDHAHYLKISNLKNPFGDGDSAGKIVGILRGVL